jgi:hypothetical protein
LQHYKWYICLPQRMETPTFACTYLLQGSSAADKAYIRKLESRLLSVKSAVELQGKCLEYKAQVRREAEPAFRLSVKKEVYLNE